MSEKKIRPFNLNSGGECNRWDCPSFDRDPEQNCCHSETSKVCIHSKEKKKGLGQMIENLCSKEIIGNTKEERPIGKGIEAVIPVDDLMSDQIEFPEPGM